MQKWRKKENEKNMANGNNGKPANRIATILALMYIVAAAVIIICAPIGAIFLIVKACGSSALSWLGACMPVIIALAFVPIYVFAKTLIDTRSGK